MDVGVGVVGIVAAGGAAAPCLLSSNGFGSSVGDSAAGIGGAAGDSPVLFSAALLLGLVGTMAIAPPSAVGPAPGSACGSVSLDAAAADMVVCAMVVGVVAVGALAVGVVGAASLDSPVCS